MSTRNVLLLTLQFFLLILPAVSSAHQEDSHSQLHVNVKSFGAKGDGVADDTKAIQKALDQGGRLGKSVFFQAGTYRITNPLRVKSFTTLIGIGVSSTLKSTGHHILESSVPEGSYIERLYIFGLIFDSKIFTFV